VSDRDHILAGVGRSDITPAPGTPQGIWGAQTHERGVAADMPLFATALALSDARETALIMDVDVIGFSPEWAQRILDATASLTGVQKQNIRIAASHTHSGPKTVRLEVVREGLDMGVEYLESLPLRIAGAAWQAVHSLQPARIAAGSGSCAINVNRRVTLPNGRVVVGRNWQGASDQTVRVVRFDDLGEKPVATVVHYACHPTIMAWDNQWFTPDYPGMTRQVVEREMGGLCLFLQGASGSVGPVRGFTGDRSVYRRLGRMLGLEASKVALGLETLPRRERFVGVMESGADIALYEDEPVEPPAPEFRIRSRIVTLPAAQYPPIEELTAQAEMRKDELERARESGDPAAIRSATARATRASILVNRSRMLKGASHLERELQGIRVGSVAFLSMPDEPFIELGQEIVAASPFIHTLFSGYSNGNSGYLPTRAAFAEGGYEVWASLYSADAADILVREAVSLLRELASDDAAAA
jgi:neutral ceramidase